MAKLNVATKTEADVRASKNAEVEQIEADGGKVEIDADGAKYSVTEAFGLTIRTRID